MNPIATTATATAATETTTAADARVVRSHTVEIDGLPVFYREAGNPAAPTIVLLHGFPSSSAMFRDLIRELADDFHLVAPDHIGFGRSAMPSVDDFAYSFDALTDITLALLDRLGLDRFALYIHDYGAPIGLRIASAHPQRVTAIVSQSGNAYVEGFTPFWDILFAHAKDRATHEPDVRALLEADATRWQHTHGVPSDRLDRVDPDAWHLDQAYLDRPGNKEIQLQLFWDYQFNLDGYPTFQEYFRTHRPPTLITWGANDEIFGAEGARAYARDLPDAEIHLLDAGHFALETHGPEIADHIRDFLGRNRT
ncbi:alpha/beta fold hydrolase [Embleya sp. NPDC008237]|uniref:alpha/beta fold hydrolase n=1 Tax=Embleya sp. NPDC008237 TaxID=3363978 RepID=UPI0036E7D4CF